MINDYIMIIGDKDLERFRRFHTGHDRNIIKSIDKLHDSENIWALGPSTSQDLWSGIQKDDRIFFAKNGLSFNHCGIVSGKITNRSCVIKIWGDTPRMREHDRLILFSTIQNVNIPFNMVCRSAGIKSTGKFTNLYLAKNKITKIIKPTGKIPTGIVMISTDGMPDKNSEVVTRFIRDTKKVKELKKLYNDKCQICGYTINPSKNTRYSEVHHLHPLKDGGDDDFDNMMVLCPTHHVEFDYKIIGIHNDGKTIIDRIKNPIGCIHMKKGHILNAKNIQYHLSELKRK